MIENILLNFIKRYNISPNSDEKGKMDAAFELLSCVVAFNKSPFFAKDNCWNCIHSDNKYETNKNDGKVDGYNIESNHSEITIELLQSKNSTKISITDVREYFNSINDHILDLDSELTMEYIGLNKIRDLISKAKITFPKAILKYKIFLTCREINNNTKRNVESAFKTIFKNNPLLELSIIQNDDFKTTIESIKKNVLNEIFTKNEYSLKFVEPLSMILAGTSQVILGVVEANEIIELIDDELKVNIDLTRLFAGNVRGFLENTQLNKDIRTTIEKESYSFLSKNNGIVVLCDKITVQPKNKSALIVNPVIINGQQTVASIYLYAKKASQKDNIKVVVKIIEIDSQKKEEEALEIAKASNSSNVIDELDLLSNRPLIKSIKKFFGDKNIYIKVRLC